VWVESGDRDDQVGSGLRNEEEENDEVAIESVEEDEFVPYDWNKLEADRKASRKYAGQVENVADALHSKSVVVASLGIVFNEAINVKV